MAVQADSTPTPKIPSLRPRGCPAGVHPVAWRKALGERLNALLDAQAAIIEALDAMDGDPDLEALGDEFDASYPEGGQRHFGNGVEFEDSEFDGTEREKVDEDGDELDTREADGLEYGERDDAETDSGEPIEGNGSAWL